MKERYNKFILSPNRKWKNIKKSAYRRKIEFSLSVTDVRRMFDSLQDSCVCCGKKFETEPNSMYYPSIDRIYAEEGYHNNNVIIICRRCNSFKGNYENGFMKKKETPEYELIHNFCTKFSIKPSKTAVNRKIQQKESDKYLPESKRDIFFN